MNATTSMTNKFNGKTTEFHLFAGIGGGIYGGILLGHECVGAVEIGDYQKVVLSQRQTDGWMNKFTIHSDICKLDGSRFKGSFDILCGGFPCQAFSTAAHGKNIPEKNLWGEMFRFAKESDAPVIFAENVVLRAIEKAKEDLASVGYEVKRIRLSCSDLGADHQRNRFWLLAVKDKSVFGKISSNLLSGNKLSNGCWTHKPDGGALFSTDEKERRKRLLGIGNAQSPIVAATAFRILTNRFVGNWSHDPVVPSDSEISCVFKKDKSWIQTTFNDIGLLHTPTTMANYSCKSMMKHQGCRNFSTVFERPEPNNAEYLMGFPTDASTTHPLNATTMKPGSVDPIVVWKKSIETSDPTTLP